MRAIPYSRGYQFHTGVDILGAHGLEIWAAAAGTVAFSGYRGNSSNLVISDHGLGHEIYYAHLSGFTATAGDEVEIGQLVG